jgi:uncharacterized sulfatase
LQPSLEKGERRQDVLIQISESQVGRAVCTPKWKYSVFAPRKNGYLSMNAKTYREEFLYDLEKDPFELNNLITRADYEDVRREMRQLLQNRMAEAGEIRPIIKAAKKPKGK